MRLCEYFFGRDRRNQRRNLHRRRKVTLHRTWLDTYIDVVKSDVIAGLKRAKTLNLSKQENSAMHELLHNDSIVIRPADKGLGIVIVNREDYISKLNREINNSDTEGNRGKPCRQSKSASQQNVQGGCNFKGHAAIPDSKIPMGRRTKGKS